MSKSICLLVSACRKDIPSSASRPADTEDAEDDKGSFASLPRRRILVSSVSKTGDGVLDVSDSVHM
jgi:hypothetical protein